MREEVIDNASRETPALTVEQLRSIFLRPDVPLKAADDACVPVQTDSSQQNEVAIAQHDCETNDYDYVELWAIPCDKSHVADQWSISWRIVDDGGRVLMEYVGFCPFCGIDLDDQIDTFGYYKYVGHEDIATHEAPARPRPGSTKATEPSSSVSVWLPASAHDRLIELAKREEQSISKTIRELLNVKLR